VWGVAGLVAGRVFAIVPAPPAGTPARRGVLVLILLARLFISGSRADCAALGRHFRSAVDAVASGSGSGSSCQPSTERQITSTQISVRFITITVLGGPYFASTEPGPWRPERRREQRRTRCACGIRKRPATSPGCLNSSYPNRYAKTRRPTWLTRIP